MIDWNASEENTPETPTRDDAMAEVPRRLSVSERDEGLNLALETPSKEGGTLATIPQTPSYPQLPPPPPSVSSTSGERSLATPAQIRAFEATPVTDHQTPIPDNWRPRLTELWVRFPGHLGPVWGWFRTGAGDLPDSFFSSDGDVRTISLSALGQYARPSVGQVKPEDEPHACRLHPLLHPAARTALKNSRYFRDSTRKYFTPIRTRGDWQICLDQGKTTALGYALSCTLCGLVRLIKRTNSLIVENLPGGYQFRCADIGAGCHVATLHNFDFVTNPLDMSTSTQAAPLYPQLPVSSMAHSQDLRLSQDNQSQGDDFSWRRRLKLCTNVPKFRGTDSPVLLATWVEAMQEALDEARVPPGRTQVCGASMFFADAAQRWWESRAGLRKGNALATFQDLCIALEKSFIPPDAAARTIAKWNTLRQRGTVEAYLKEADELSLAHPMGDDGEFWQIWNGLRPELKYEVRYALKTRKQETLSRADLRDLLETVEVKYPPLPSAYSRPFNPRFIRRAEAKTVQTAPKAPLIEGTALVICWICDRAGHRAPECNRRKTSGCPRCGSKAHNLMACPQRKSAVIRPPQTSNKPPHNAKRPTPRKPPTK